MSAVPLLIAACARSRVGTTSCEWEPRPSGDTPMAWEATAAHPGAVRLHVVLITDSGDVRPAVGGWVLLAGDSTSRRLAETGELEVRVAGPGPLEVQAGRLGYERARATLVVPPDSGAVAVVVLRRARTMINEFCGDGYPIRRR